MGKKLEKNSTEEKVLKKGIREVRTGKGSFNRGQAVLLVNISGFSILQSAPNPVIM